jgi:hypothetical protein
MAYRTDGKSAVWSLPLARLEHAMPALSSQPDEYLTAPRADGLFKACAEVLGATTHAYRKIVARQSRNLEAAHQRDLEALLDQLGLAADPVAIQCFGLDGATDRAVANITGWMAYLPADCVGSMVRDGWHWST